MDDDPKRTAIDPIGCGCTECLIGEYVPIDCATEDDIAALLAGEVADHTDSIWMVARDNFGRTTVSASNGGTWDFDHPIPVMLNADGTAIYDSAAALARSRRTR